MITVVKNFKKKKEKEKKYSGSARFDPGASKVIYTRNMFKETCKETHGNTF